MKKYLLLLLCTITVGLSSCKKELIAPSNRTIIVDIAGKSWITNDGGVTYYTNIQVPENDANFNQRGHIVLAMAFENPDVYEGLPQVYLGISYTFTSQPGSVTIYQNAVSGAVINQPVGVSTAKITLIDSEIID